jgi:hypothetical protein
MPKAQGCPGEERSDAYLKIMAVVADNRYGYIGAHYIGYITYELCYSNGGLLVCLQTMVYNV